MTDIQPEPLSDKVFHRPLTLLHYARQHALNENTSLGGLPLLRQELGHMTEQRLLEMDAVLIELLRLIEVAEDQ